LNNSRHHHDDILNPGQKAVKKIKQKLKLDKLKNAPFPEFKICFVALFIDEIQQVEYYDFLGEVFDEDRENGDRLVISNQNAGIFLQKFNSSDLTILFVPLNIQK
jgi:hypothetical protein